MSEEYFHLLQEIRNSQVRTEQAVKHLTERVAGHHRSLYGDDGSRGVVGRQRRTEVALRTMAWIVVVSVPVLTAAAVAVVQAL